MNLLTRWCPDFQSASEGAGISDGDIGVDAFGDQSAIGCSHVGAHAALEHVGRSNTRMWFVAVLALEEAVADALIAIDLIQTLGVIVAGVGFTFVDVDHAILAFKPGCAGAGVLVDAIVTGAAIKTWLLGAIIHVDFAVLAIEAVGTLAVIVVDQIGAFSPVLTRFGLAFIDVHVAVLPLETGQAIALEVVDEVHAACSVLAGLALFAFVDLRLTKGAGEAGFAIALDFACLGLPNTILTVTVLLAVETH